MAAYAAVVSLMNNIEQIMIHPRLSTCFDNKQIQPLVERAGFLLDFIEGCFSHGGGGNKETTEDLESRITAAAYAAEDVIESHIVDQIHAGTTEVLSLTCSLQLQQIIQDIDAIINEATTEKQSWEEVKSTHTAEPLMEIGQTSLVGLDDELSKLLHEVTWDQTSRRILSIVGMGGTGKTTLATTIYQHPLVNQRFDIRFWATISQQYSAEHILSKLLSSIGKSSSGTVDALGDKLHKSLIGRKYLIVLDDIWSVEAWDKVRRFLPVQNGSRVVLTTRLSSVATDCGSSFDLKLDLLDEDKSWKLFCDKASFFPHKDDPLQLEDVGKEIVESCKGLALSIAVIGGLLLKSPRTVEYWKSVAKDMKSIRDSKEKQESLDVLSLSYSHLPPHLKPCFLYMGVFDEDSKIRVSNLIKLWIGEGFLKSPNGNREIEEVAEGYINDLIDRNLILVGKRRSNGRIGFCGIHDLLRDLAIKIADEHDFFHLNNRGTEHRRRIIGYDDDPTKLPLARSLIRSSYRKRITSKCRLLRVFDRDDETREDYCQNVNLRYLSQHIFFGVLQLPSSVSLLWSLQTLIIKVQGSIEVIIAPNEFWKMRQLRHVQCDRIHLPIPPADEALVLEKLQTLKTAVNLIVSERVCSMIPNIKKLHLRYNDDLCGYDKAYADCLSNLELFHKLESLNVTCDVLESRFTYQLSPRYPRSLKKLQLKGCRLGWKHMSVVGQRLEVLKLEYSSVLKGLVWRPEQGQFLRLKFLKIDGCSLVDWDADSSHFPVLEKLILRRSSLKEIPSDIGEIATLRLIYVVFCSEDVVFSAIKIKQDRLENDDSGDLQVQVTVTSPNFKRLEKMLEAEDLTTDHIQIEVI